MVIKVFTSLQQGVSFQMFAAERMRTKPKAIGRAKARWGV